MESLENLLNSLTKIYYDAFFIFSIQAGFISEIHFFISSMFLSFLSTLLLSRICWLYYINSHSYTWDISYNKLIKVWALKAILISSYTYTRLKKKKIMITWMFFDWLEWCGVYGFFKMYKGMYFVIWRAVIVYVSHFLSHLMQNYERGNECSQSMKWFTGGESCKIYKSHKVQVTVSCIQLHHQISSQQHLLLV